LTYASFFARLSSNLCTLKRFDFISNFEKLNKMAKENKFQKFIRVRTEVHAAKLKNFSDYEAKREKNNWPSQPRIHFLNYGWNGWEDYLGCEKKSEMFIRFKDEIKKANILNYSHYEEVRNKMGWPSRPERDFKGFGWCGWEDYFGKKLKKIKVKVTKETLVPFSVLKGLTKGLNITNSTEYLNEAKNHSNWPTDLSIYKEYTNFDEFIDKYIPLDQLRIEVKKYKVVFRKDYKFIREQNNFLSWPVRPEKHYAGWKNWSDLVGQKVPEQIKTKDFLPLDVLKYFVQKAGIKSYPEYSRKRKADEGWPSNPYAHYTSIGEWTNYPDLFGNKK